MTKIKVGLQNCLYLGNLNAKRDWGHAKDFVEAQWLILQQHNPDDFVISTEKQHSVRDFVNLVAKDLNMEILWRGEGLNEIGSYNGMDIVKIDPRYFRPSEVNLLKGDSTKAKKKLNWSAKISIEQLVEEMVKKDLDLANKEKLIQNKFK